MKISKNVLWIAAAVIGLIIVGVVIFCGSTQKKQPQNPKHDMKDDRINQSIQQQTNQSLDALSQAPDVQMNFLTDPSVQSLPQAHPFVSQNPQMMRALSPPPRHQTQMEKQYGQQGQAPAVGVYSKMLDQNPATNSLGVGQGLGSGGGNQFGEYEYL